jgi:hypothetical protein
MANAAIFERRGNGNGRGDGLVMCSSKLPRAPKVQ